MDEGERLAVLETKIDLLIKWIGDGDSGLVKRVSALERFQAWAEKLLTWAVAPIGVIGMVLGALAKPIADKLSGGGS